MSSEMDLSARFNIDDELKAMGSEQLRRERNHILSDLKSLQDQIGDLAFNNYRTYADAGRTTQYCTEIFTEMKDKLRTVSAQVPELSSELTAFHARTKDLTKELELVKSACQKENAVWELLSLPSRMDVCIRAGYYEAAYLLTNYGMVLQQHSVIKNPLIKGIADKLVEARSFLLEELFNKFSGPLDLASSIQVVNNVRKMPYLTPTQLRTCILQHRDVYLDRQILDITNHPEFAIKAIEIYRDCMYDTLVLYLAVFPENETHRKDLSLDPRWETWPSSAPSSVLGQWTARNITQLLDLIRRTDMKQGVDMVTVWSKLMSLAASLGRMGLDFRALVVETLVKISLERFTSAIRVATNKILNETKVLTVSCGEITFLAERETSENAPPQPSSDISMWDDICVYGNAVLEALNNLRYSSSPMLVQSVVLCLRDSMRSIVQWLLGHSSSPHFTKAVEILCLHFAPFLGRCIRFLFPFSAISRLFGTSVSSHVYESFTDLNMRAIISSCNGGEKIEEIIRGASAFREQARPEAEIEGASQQLVDDNTVSFEAAPAAGNIPNFSDTSMCTPPDSSTIQFDLGDVAEESAQSSIPDDSDRLKSSSAVAAVGTPGEQSGTADTQLSVATEDELPALVDTAPSPFYCETDLGNKQDNDWPEEHENLEGISHSKEG
ncbi:unnamed protein product [Nippostrongylus brasiliensis]|uniref:Conserved oligomeric Golgi complex subunit 8 n=1 Tax=Nippostrongylus brasiliensis TaxID=27835 RepID=A0A158QZW4_NIPBR|nr:unnamed protein product [Nippostrongylus brasiliensis]